MKKFKLEIRQDDFTESPRDWDNLGTMVCFHKNYKLGDKHNYKIIDYDNWQELKQAIQENEKVHTILPLYMYDHSGITISTTPFDCKFDSGQIGFIYISKDKIKKEGIDETKVEEYIKGEVKTYDQYLTGDVWRYTVYEIETCDKGCEHEEEVESCWGIYGHDECENLGNTIIKQLQNN